MASAMVCMKWKSYTKGVGEIPFMSRRPLTYNSKQKRLHELETGDKLWLISRCTDDNQFYIVACLDITDQRLNFPGYDLIEFGKYSVVASDATSRDFGKRVPADEIVRQLQFSTGKGVKLGTKLGNSLQSIRSLTESDSALLEDFVRA